ncbi:MAG: hypothetical protein JW839_09350, partial [Candidatus Lokiarchaeota archaeon]|nr:hypothetical protein [Candidatus Lokiarchaeota archaeon]
EREILRKGKKATPHVGVKGINEIPVPAFSHRARETIIRFVDEILEPNSGSAELANKATPVVNKAALTGIDRVIYEAFDLDAGEITSIDGAVDPLFE